MKRNRNSKGKDGSRTDSVQNHESLTTMDSMDNGRRPASAEIIHVLESLQALRDGEFSTRLPGSWTGLSGKLADTFNEIAAANQQIAAELERVGQAVGKQGQTSERARFHESRGAWGEMSVSINSLVEDLLRPTEEVTRAIAAVAHGNLNQRLRLDVNGRPLEGEFLVSANIVNTMIQQLGVFAAEVTRVAREVGTDGKLGGQAVVSGAAGTWKDLTDSVNLMASNLTGQVRNIAEVATAVASGDLSRKITVDVRGEILQLKEAINTMVDQLRSFASEVTRVAREVGTEGKLGGQAVVPYVAGTWKDLTDSVNAMASNLTAQVRNIAEVTTAVARGDLSRKITVDVKGEILELKDTVNTMVDQLNAFAGEVTRVAREVGTEGKLGGQAKVPGVGGTWKDLTDNVNFMASNLTGQVRNIADVATAIANGDLSRKITVDVRGEILQLKETLNTMVDQLNRFAGEVTRVAREVGTEGKLGGQADVPRVAGTWKDLTDSVNSMAGNLTAQVRNIAEVTTAVARGDLSRKITADVKGELLELKNTINTMVDQLNAFAAEVTRVAKEVGTDGKLGGQAQVRGVAGTWKDLTDNVNVMAANLTEQVRGIVKVVTAVADGDLTQTLTVNAKGEVAALAETINNMTRTLATFADQVTTVAHEVGVEGRLGGQARVPGAAGTWKDLTGNVNLLANNLTNQVRAIAEVATAVTKGDLTRSIQVEASGELVELKDNINTMIHNLRLTTEHNTEQDWLKSNLARVTGMLQGQRDLATVGEMLLSQLVPLVNAQQGVIYKVEEGDSSLALLSSFAGHRGGGNFYGRRVKQGEGLVGQCAAERRSMLITDIPPDAVPIRSGILRALPRSVMVLPVLFEGRLKAVIELASLNSFTQSHLAFLEQLSSTVGIMLNSIEATMQTEALLKQSQDLAVELQTQKKELQQTNEQLAQKAQQLAEQNVEVERKNKEIEQARMAVEEKAKELAITSKYKSDFLANMSHELRSPLNSILVLGQQLSSNSEGNLTERQVEFARTIYAAGTDLLNLIGDILDLSKIESGTVSVEAGEVVIASLVEAVARPFRHEAEEKRLSFDVHIDPQLHSMVTDSKRLQQILKNLLSNAFKFTEKGGISLSAYPAKKGPDGKSDVLGSAEQVIAFEVTDTGIGIPADKQQMIFEAFQQADAGTSRRYGGTGLGLAISRELAGLLGGGIRLQSIPGGGSTFTLYLPLRHQSVPSPSRVSAPTKNVIDVVEKEERVDDDRDTIQAGDLVLLIIEDAPHFARLLCDLSRDNGFKVLLASRGADGLALAHRFHPTAISLDVFLPDMLGWTVLNHLKHDPDTRHIPVQMLTVDEDRRHGLSRGAFAFVTKPAQTQRLEEALARIKDYVAPRRKRLLVVEDSPREQFSIRQLLDYDDIDLVVVGRGEDALRTLQEEKVDCVVLDLRLPDMSGFDLLERLSENPESSDVPVVVFTGKVLSAEEDARLRTLARSVVVKGVESPERLLDETALFLHRLIADLPAEKQALLEKLHQSDEALVGKNVLVVDDDVRNIFAVASVLERHGMSVVTAETGQEALAKIASNPDMAMVLMDIMMPDMDGYETIRAIRQTVSLGRLPIIALTAKAMKGDREKCFDAGASEYLAKPVNTEQLLSVLRMLLHR